MDPPSLRCAGSPPHRSVHRRRSLTSPGWRHPRPPGESIVTPLAGARALYGLALPAVMGIAARQRHRSRSESQGGRTDRLADDTPSQDLTRLGRRQLRAVAAEGADLHRYHLRRAPLAGLDLSGADLSGTDLTGARLRRTDLSGADLTRTILDHADLSRSVLRGAVLHATSLLESDLAAADLRGVDLTACRQLAMANLRHAVYDRSTLWPPGIDPLYAGAIAAAS